MSYYDVQCFANLPPLEDLVSISLRRIITQHLRCFPSFRNPSIWIISYWKYFEGSKHEMRISGTIGIFTSLVIFIFICCHQRWDNSLCFFFGCVDNFVLRENVNIYFCLSEFFLSTIQKIKFIGVPLPKILLNSVVSAVTCFTFLLSLMTSSMRHKGF